MTNQYIKPTAIAGLYKIERETFSDERGFFREIFHLDELEQILGYSFKSVQWNHSSSKPGVIRGIHPDPWDKLLYPVNGKVFVAVADIDPLSATFKKVENFMIDDSHRFALFTAKGLGNSFCVMGDQAVDYMYLVTAYWDGNAMSGMRAIAWNDPDLAINWPVKNPIISEKDQHNKTLREYYKADYPDLFK